MPTVDDEKTGSCATATENDDEIKNTEFEYILDLAMEKYEYENHRRQELIQQSGQMQAAFSFMTAAVFMALPVAIDHRGNLSENFFLLMISIIVFFLLLSLVLASVAAWRWNTDTLGNISEIKKSIIDSEDWEKYLKKYNRMSAKIDALEKVQKSNEEVNNTRARLIRLSMIAFWCSIGSIVIFFFIAVYKLWH